MPKPWEKLQRKEKNLLDETTHVYWEKIILLSVPIFVVVVKVKYVFHADLRASIALVKVGQFHCDFCQTFTALALRIRDCGCAISVFKVILCIV